MTKIIGNCVSILVLSSALPVMSRTLGITRFDLLGDFGRFNWLGNFYIVLSYNLLFAIVTTLCLVRKFTSAVREELFKALGLHKLHLSDTSRDSETTKPSANGHQKALWDLAASVAFCSKSWRLLTFPQTLISFCWGLGLPVSATFSSAWRTWHYWSVSHLNFLINLRAFG